MTREEWEYLLKEENHPHEWTTIEGQQGLKVMADDKENFLFLYPNNTLVWPADGDTGSMYSLRAYFKINPSGQSANAPLQQFAPRMVIRPSSVPTALEQSQITNHQSQIKLLENGQFIIIRENKEYNAQGQIYSGK